MKKRFVLTLLTIAAIVCMLAISVSATEINGVHYNLNISNQTAEVSTDNKTSTTTIVTIPSTVEYEGVTYMVTSIASSAFSGNNSMVELRILSEYITAIPFGMISNTYSSGTLKKIYVDFTNIKTIAEAGFNPSSETNGNSPKQNSFFYYDAKAFSENGSDILITAPDFSNTSTIGQAAFQGANFEKLTIPAHMPFSSQMFRMSTIKELVIEGEDRETFGYYCFAACTSLEKITVKSRNLLKIQSDTFTHCKNVKEIYIDLSKCTSIGGSAFVFSHQYDAGNTTTQWYNLEGEKVIDLSSVEKLENSCFASSNIGSAKIAWPKALTTLADQAFRRCNITQPMLINAAEGVTLSLPFWCFHGNSPSILVCNEGVTSTSLSFSKTTAIFLADSIKIARNDGCFRDGSTLYCKSITDDSYAIDSKHCTVVPITSGTIANYGLCGFVATITANEENIVIGQVNHTTSDAINNAYCPVGKVTETTCKFCDYITHSIDGETIEPKVHEYVLVGSITYVNFFDMGYKTNKCQCGDEKTSDTATENAIFVLRGISYSEFADKDGNFSVTQGYCVNRTAYENYINSGKSLEYGLVVAGKNVVGTQPLTVEDGKVCAVSEKAYLSKQSMLPHDYINIKVTGISPTNNGAEIIMCMFIFNGENISYLNNIDGVAAQSTTANTVVLNLQ